MKISIILFCMTYLAVAHGFDKSDDDITPAQYFNMSQSVLDISNNYLACGEPKLRERTITHYVEPIIKNNLTMKEGQRHERWMIDACGRSAVILFIVDIAPERENYSSFNLLFSEINDYLINNPDRKLQKKYEELVLGEWELPDNGKNDLWTSTTFLPNNKMIYRRKKKDNPQSEDISEYELIGRVLCNTVIETKNSHTPIEFLMCKEIVNLTEDSMELKKGPEFVKPSPENTYKLFRVN